ncbi:hypothetical protein [Aeromonas caviae]|uniref:hypothetical protein n=1 Tax=Aeromonas caviae TaxID=648 RepID=UPI0022A76E7C
MDAIIAALEGGMSKAAVCRNFGVKRTTLIETLTRASRPASEFRSRWSASRRSCGTRPPWTCHLRARR